METGLRASELASLTRSSFDLEGERPTVTIAARAAKSRQERTLPLRPATAQALQEALGEGLPAVRVFAMPPIYAVARMLRRDLEAAGMRYADDSGRVADFHALRHTFLTWLKDAQVHPKTAMSLARHSSATLTLDRYTHSSDRDELEAVRLLPDLSLHRPAELAATGTGPACDVGTEAGKPQRVLVPGMVSGDRIPPTETDDDGRSEWRDAPEPTDRTPSFSAENATLDGERKAEAEGFEPSVPCGTAVFKTAAIGRSATPPVGERVVGAARGGHTALGELSSSCRTRA